MSQDGPLRREPASAAFSHHVGDEWVVTNPEERQRADENPSPDALDGADASDDAPPYPCQKKRGSPGMKVGQDLVLGLKAPVLQGFRGSGGLLGDAHVW